MNKRSPKRTPAFQTEFAFVRDPEIRWTPALDQKWMCIDSGPEVRRRDPLCLHPEKWPDLPPPTCYADRLPAWLRKHA